MHMQSNLDESHLASATSVAGSTDGLLLATQREIHSNTARRECIAFLGSSEATVSSRTCEGFENHV